MLHPEIVQLTNHRSVVFRLQGFSEFVRKIFMISIVFIAEALFFTKLPPFLPAVRRRGSLRRPFPVFSFWFSLLHA